MKPNVINMTYNEEKQTLAMRRKVLTPQEKPLFITTVKKGEFLPPPASMASLLGMSSCERLVGVGAPTLLYSYASKPKMVALAGGNTQMSNSEGARGALAALASLAVAAAGLPSR